MNEYLCQIMTMSKILLVLFFAVVTLECAHAQRSHKVTKSRYHFSTPKPRGSKAKIICPTFDKSRYPLHGLGIKLGDPFAVTYKFYPNKRVSFAVDFGKAASGLYNSYFRDKFKEYVSQDNFLPAASSISYISHRVESDFIGEAKILFHLDAGKISEGLQGYVGAGWEWKRTDLRYDYEFNQNANDIGTDDPFGSFNRSRVTMGPQLIIGIEYAYFTVPIAAFMEVEYFTDIQADPGFQRFEGGVGLTYIF